MITGERKSQIDNLWTQFWQGGIANPLTVIEQISFLMFSRMLDIAETKNERREARTKKSFKHVFNQDEQHLRWSHFKQLGADEMLPLIRDKVFPHFRTIAAMETQDGTKEATFHEYFKDAQLMIQKPSLLVDAVNMIDDLPLTEGDAKGDLYEYLLSKLTTAGINGQFRTPRHIIRLMIEMLDPQPTETICDPACGTGGFLATALDFMLRQYSSLEGQYEVEVDDKTETIYTGDLLEDHWEHIRNNMFHGFDFDATMLRIAAMNMLLHGVDTPDIHYQDTLATSFTDNFKNKSENAFDIVLANPPFKGAIDYDDVHPSLLRKIKTKKTELLFLVLILKLLKPGGRCAVIVPDGVLFGSSKAHQELRRLLVDENQLEGVISLPSGVFKPYAGVSTAILIFTKGGRTDDVFFYKLDDDGFSLDDKRTQLYETAFAGDLPDALKRWKRRDPQTDKDNTEKAFFVSAESISANKYDLSVNKYWEEKYEAEVFERPATILNNLRDIEREIERDIEELETLIQ